MAKKVSKKARWMCCCVSGNDETDNLNSRARTISDQDYLLPGGEWDPSLSTASHISRRVSARRSNSREHPDKIERDGLYQPPTVLPSRVLPTFDDFKLLNTVGRGAFGKVLLCVHQSTRILYAMKVVPKAKIVTQKQITQILAESNILKKIRHPFCVSLQYAFQNDDYIFYVFEFAAGGMLFYHLRQAGRFNEPRARFYFGEIILAMDYLHTFGIIFRDLKPENCMLSEKGHIVLTDFGSAKMLEQSQKTSTIAGTPQYIAPEVLRGEPYSFSADWWSCGILLYEMLTGKTPFYSPDRVELYKLVLRGDFIVPRGVSPRARSLMYRLINRDPDFRIGCASDDTHIRPVTEIKEHPFFSHAPLDPDEESQYSIEETERERHREAFQRQKRAHSHRNGSFMETAGTVMRSISDTTKRLSFTRHLYQGIPCEWTWEELEAREITPPFKPKLASPTDLRHFDPTLTNLPPTITDLITTDRALHLEGFDYVAAVEEDEDVMQLSDGGETPDAPNEGGLPISSTGLGVTHNKRNGDLNGSSSEDDSPVVSTHLVTAEINDF